MTIEIKNQLNLFTLYWFAIVRKASSKFHQVHDEPWTSFTLLDGKKSSSSVLAQALNQFEFTQPRDGKYFEVKCLSLESGLWLHSRFLEWVRACESSAWFDTKNEGKLKKYFDLIENRLYVKSIKRKLLKSVAKNQDKTQTVCEKQNKVVNDRTHSRAARSKSLVTRCM